MINNLKDRKEELFKALNTFYVEKGYDRKYLNLFGIRDDASPDEWNDVIGFFTPEGMIHIFQATTDPGLYYQKNPLNRKGTAWMCEGFHENIWKHGKHRKYPALIQTGNKVKVYRNLKQGYAPGKGLDVGYFGINHHRAHATKDAASVGGYSAGCQVIRKPEDWEFAFSFYEKYKLDTYSYLLLNKDSVEDTLGIKL